MSRRSRPRLVPGLLLGLLGLTVQGLLAGCDGSATCVFTTGCRSSASSGSLGGPGSSATLPAEGAYVDNRPPTIQAIFPDRGNLSPDTPVVVVFSESMGEASLQDLFDLLPVGAGTIQPPVPLAEQFLVGDGRVLVLLPALPLQVNTYIVRVSTRFGPTAEDLEGLGLDVTGQALDLLPGTQLSQPFNVSPAPAAEPQVMFVWPRDGATGISATTEVAVLFDRAVDATTVTSDSVEITLDDADPVPDPDPLPVVFELMGMPVPDTRVFQWRSVGPAGPVAHPVGATLEVTVSPAAAPIRIQMGTEEVVERTFAATLQSLATPTSLEILSVPTTAVGIRNLTAGDAEALELQAQLTGAQAGDVVDLFLFGTNRDLVSPMAIALRRERALTGAGPFPSVRFQLAELDLLRSSDPTDARFAEGTISAAIRLRRDPQATPLHVLDVDLATPGVQEPELDLTRPVLQSLDFAAPATEPASELRDVVLTGVASEGLRSVEVSIPMGAMNATNGSLPPVVAGAGGGRFIAAPVPLGADGLLAGASTAFTAVAYDHALNTSGALNGTLHQRGAVGPGTLAIDQPVEVEAFDARTLAPVPGALVVLHSDPGGGPITLHRSGVTGVDGRVTLVPGDAPALRLVSVDAAGYDLFTFHGITSNRLSVPLAPIGAGATAALRGTVSTGSEAVRTAFPGLDLGFDDARRPADAVQLQRLPACAEMDDELVCPRYGPIFARPRRLGAASLLAGNFRLTAGTYDPAVLVQSFCLAVPTGTPANLVNEELDFEVPFLLADAGPEEEAVDLPAFRFHADAATGIDLGSLVGDAGTTGLPRVTVETTIPGVPGTVSVGVGLAFENPAGSNRWDVRAAAPGAVRPTGFYGMSGTLDTDLLLRCELRDAAGNVSAARIRESALGAPLLAASVPVLLGPVGNTLGRSFDLTFAETILGAAGQAGLYRARLVDAAGRGWTIWRPDGPGDGMTSLHVPDLSGAMGSALADGTLRCELRAVARAGLALDAFLWSGLERVEEQLAIAAPVLLQQP